MKYSPDQSWTLEIYCRPHAGRSFAWCTIAFVLFMLPSDNTLASVEMHVRPISPVMSDLGSLNALLREDHDVSVFVMLRDVREKRDIRIRASLPLLDDWLPGLLTGPCVCADRCRKVGPSSFARSDPRGDASSPPARPLHRAVSLVLLHMLL